MNQTKPKSERAHKILCRLRYSVSQKPLQQFELLLATRQTNIWMQITKIIKRFPDFEKHSQIFIFL